MHPLAPKGTNRCARSTPLERLPLSLLPPAVCLALALAAASGAAHPARQRRAVPAPTSRAAGKPGPRAPVLSTVLLEARKFASFGDAADFQRGVAAAPGVTRAARQQYVEGALSLEVTTSRDADTLAETLESSERLKVFGLRIVRVDRRGILMALPETPSPAKVALVRPDQMLTVSVDTPIKNGESVAALQEGRAQAVARAIEEAARPYLLPGSAPDALRPVVAQGEALARVARVVDWRVSDGTLHQTSEVWVGTVPLIKALIDQRLARQGYIMAYVHSSAAGGGRADTAQVEAALTRGLLRAGHRVVLLRLAPGLPPGALERMKSMGDAAPVLRAASEGTGAELALLADLAAEGGRETVRAHLVAARTGEVLAVYAAEGRRRIAAMLPSVGPGPEEAAARVASEAAVDAARIDPARLQARPAGK